MSPPPTKRGSRKPPEPEREIKVFPDSDGLFREAAERIVRAAESAGGREPRRFTMLLSGGNTPRRLYALLASRAFASRIDWSRTHLFWGDERGVPIADPQSNYRMVSETLLSRVTVPEQNVHRIHTELPPDDAAMQYELELREFFGGAPRFDVALLGMGADGHTASLYPCSEALRETGRLVVSTVQETPRRITLTLAALNAAEVIFLVTGASKAPALAAVLEGPPDPDLPAALVNPNSAKVVWLADAAAAGRLTRKQA